MRDNITHYEGGKPFFAGEGRALHQRQDPGLGFSFPTGWHYDVLRGLDCLRGAGIDPDDRIAEAIELVEKNRRSAAAPLVLAQQITPAP